MTEADKPTTCARHPNVQTNLRCASCGVPICPKCLVQTPVGSKCKQCGSGSGSVLYQPSRTQMLLALLAGVVTGVVAGWGVQFSMGLITLFLAIVYGRIAGDMILRACGRKRGPKVELPAAAGMILGALGGRMIIAAVLLSTHATPRPPQGIWNVIVNLVIPVPIPLIALVIAIVGAISRIRYLW